MKYCFLLGCPRSGTTMLQQALNRHSRIVIPSETSFFFMIGAPREDQIARWQEIISDLKIHLPFPEGDFRKHEFVRHVFESIAAKYVEGRQNVEFFGEKTPTHQLRICEIMKAFPDGKIVLIYRDGRDVALSLSKVPWYLSSNIYLSFLMWRHYYRIQLRAIQQYPSSVYCIKYEDLVRNPEAEMRKVSEFLKIPYETQTAAGWGNQEGVLEREMGWKSQAMEKISAARVGVWRSELTDIEIGRLERMGKEELSSLGYALHTGGNRSLPLFFLVRIGTLFLVCIYWKVLFGVANRSEVRIAREAWKHAGELVRSGFRVLLKPKTRKRKRDYRANGEHIRG